MNAARWTHRLVALAAVLPVLAGTADVAAQDIHKCRDAEGRLTYQDAPCPPGTAQPAPVILPGPGYDAATATAAAPPPSGTGSAPAPVAGQEPQAPLPPLPALYQCERYDGQERYVTANGTPRRYQVPLWTTMSGNTGTAGATYTTVEDRCRRMNRGELCAHWRSTATRANQQRRTAFNDTKAVLEAERDGARELIAAHCN